MTYSQGGDIILEPPRASFNVRDLRHRLMGVTNVCGRSPDLQRLHFHDSVIVEVQCFKAGSRVVCSSSGSSI